MTPEAHRLDTLAATQIIADAEVAHCWELVRVGIQMLFPGTGNLGELIRHLHAGNGMTLDELTLEIDPPGSDRMLVGILKGKRMCSAPTMIDELERLAGRAGTASPAGGRSRSSGTPAGTPPVSRTAGAEAPDLLGLLAGLLGTTHERLAGDPTLYRAQVERVRTAAARWREVMADPHGEPASRDAAEAELRAIFTATAEHTTATAATRSGDLGGTVRALGVDAGLVAGAPAHHRRVARAANTCRRRSC